jgi:signal transduction histidine kinase
MRLNVSQRITAVLLVIAVLLLLTFNLIQWYLYGQVRSFMELRISDEVLGLAEAEAANIDPQDLISSVDDPDASATLWLVATQLENARLNHDLLGMNLYDRAGQDLLTSDSETHSTEAMLNLTEFVSAQAGISAVTPVYRSDSLYLLSAYAPVYGADDSVVAILRAEAGYAVFRTIESFRKSIIVANILSVALVVLALSALIVINRRLLISHQALLRASAISSMGEMAATIAHEIRNPLAIIRNSAERIQRKYAGDSTDPVFGFISDEVDRMNRIVAGYLDFAHPVKGEQEEFSISEMIVGLVEGMRTDLKTAGIDTAVELGAKDERYVIGGERYAIRQAILNIILNAKAAQPAGGSIDVSLRSILWRGADAVEIDVSDHGTGFPPGAVQRAFDPFFTTRDKGSGLGLYIAKSVIDGHGGSITLRNRQAGGASVLVVIPRGF